MQHQHAASATEHSKKIRILVVDPKPLLRRGIRVVCSGEPDLEISGDTGSPAEALVLADQLRPDLAVVDLSFYDEEGRPLLARLGSICATVALASDSRDVQREGGAQCRAQVVASAPDAVPQLLAAIRARAALQQLAHVCDDCQKSDHSPVASLTNRELEVLSLLSRGLGSRRIAEELRLSQKTVETHREHLKRKLGLRSGSELIAWSVSWAMKRDRSANELGGDTAALGARPGIADARRKIREHEAPGDLLGTATA